MRHNPPHALSRRAAREGTAAMVKAPLRLRLRAKVRPPNTGSYGISVFLQSWVPRPGVRAIFILLWQCRVGQVRTRGMETITGPCLVSRSDLGKYLDIQTTAHTNRRPNAYENPPCGYWLDARPCRHAGALKAEGP